MSSPMTSTPYAANYVASAPPKRPRPITATAPCCAMGVGLPMKNAAGRVRHFLIFISDVLSETSDWGGESADQRPFDRKLIVEAPGSKRQSGGDGHRSQTPEDHHQNENDLAQRGQSGGDAGRQADVAESGDDLEEDPIESRPRV